MNNNDYEEELIKDMNDLISKIDFIKEFNKDSFLKKESFEIFDKLKQAKVSSF